ncbi:MAG: IS1595 family transposase [Rhodospirillales bacterium]|nr:IS1595 family transposase [Rhodospirillales bacterium]
MNLMTVFTRFPDHESCLEHLEKVRWGDRPLCPHCGSVKVARKADGHRQGRWNCHGCKSSFNVLSGTIMQKTKIPLQKWFLAIALVLSAKKSLSSHQCARDLNLNQKTAWYLIMRIRKAMPVHGELLYGIVEADECYVGGKPRKGKRRALPSKRGRGTRKIPVLRAVERNGKVVAQPSASVSAVANSAFLGWHVAPAALRLTDEYRSYLAMAEVMLHEIVDHGVWYAEGAPHTNTNNGFWELVKRAWYGTHHHYSRAHAGKYIREACYKYKQRGNTDTFGTFLRGCFA